MNIEKHSDGSFTIGDSPITADMPTAAGHVYSRKLLEEAASEAQERIQNDQLVGTLIVDGNLPETIGITDIAVKVESLSMEGNNLNACVRTIPVHRGLNLILLLEKMEALSESGVEPTHKVRLSPRGQGTAELNLNDGNFFLTSYKLLGVDVVLESNQNSGGDRA